MNSGEMKINVAASAIENGRAESDDRARSGIPQSTRSGMREEGGVVIAEDKLLDVREAAQFLGVQIGSLYHMVSQRRVPCIRLSKRCLGFRLSDLQRLVDEEYVPAK